MSKLKFLNIFYNLLTKFNMQKISSVHFANVLVSHEVETYIKNTPLEEKLTGDTINLVTQILLGTKCDP